MWRLLGGTVAVVKTAVAAPEGEWTTAFYLESGKPYGVCEVRVNFDSGYPDFLGDCYWNPYCAHACHAAQAYKITGDPFLVQWDKQNPPSKEEVESARTNSPDTYRHLLLTRSLIRTLDGKQ